MERGSGEGKWRGEVERGSGEGKWRREVEKGSGEGGVERRKPYKVVSKQNIALLYSKK